MPAAGSDRPWFMAASYSALVLGDRVMVPREATDRMVKAMEAYQAEVWSWDRGPLESDECKELWRRLIAAAEKSA